MADINVDVILPAPINVDVTSPTQSANVGVYIPGPQGPSGPEGQVNTGELDFRYYSINNPSGFITGVDLTNYALVNDLISTGSHVDTLSGLFTGFTGALDATYATDSQLITTGSRIDTLSGLFTGFTGTLDATYATDSQLISTGSRIDTLSGQVVFLSNTQTIPGQKSFTSNSTSFRDISTRGITGAGDLTIQKVNPRIRYRDTTNNNNLSGFDIHITTGRFLIDDNDRIINILDYNAAEDKPTLTLSTNKFIIKTAPDGNYNTTDSLRISGDKILYLYARPLVNNTGVLLSGEAPTIQQLIITGSRIDTLSGNLILTGSRVDTLSGNLNSLSGDAVLEYGDQSINGIKTFTDKVYINNLYVTGVETILNTVNNNISSPYLLLNITGGLTDGGIFFVTGTGLTGINDTGIIFGFDNVTKTWHFGQGTRLTDISTLDEVMGYHDLTGYSGYANNLFAEKNNLITTGSRIDTLSGNLITTGSRIDTLSGLFTGFTGALDATYATDSQLISTGSRVDTLSGNLIITGSRIDTLSGNLITTGSRIDTLSGNLITTGSRIDTLSGLFTGFTGALDATYATDSQLISTGSRVDTLSGNLITTGSRIDALSGQVVFTTGYQIISGNKTFDNTGVFNTLSISNKQFTSYGYFTGNFNFDNNLINLTNSSNNITGTLPSNVESGINYYVKNLNTGVLLITGSGQRLIDGFSNVNLYKNESLQLIGVNNVGYTGWVTISTNIGIS